LAPKARYDAPNPQTLAGLFQQAKDSGDVEKAKGYGQWLKSQFNWEYGEGPGGWPYIMPHARSIVEREPAPRTRQLFPEEVRQARALGDHFDAAKARGDFLAMRSIGQTLKDSYGYEYGTGDGGWPYIKAPSSDVVPIDDSPGIRARKEVVARQIEQSRAEQQERAYAAANDNRGVVGRAGGGFWDALKAKFGDIEAGVGRGLQNIQEAANYYRPEAVASRLVRRPGPPPDPAISPREASWGAQIRGRGEDIAAQALHHQDIYGQDWASQAGAILGDVSANTGVAMLGGPYGVGILDATAAYGRGQPMGQALGTGVISAASMEAGGRLGSALEERAAASPLTKYLGEPFARYAGRSTGYLVGPQAVSIPGTALLYGKPEIPDSAKEIALNIAQALGYGFLPGRRDALKFIAQHQDTAPSVGAALNAILSGEIPPRVPEFYMGGEALPGPVGSDPAQTVVRTSPQMMDALLTRGVAGDNKSIMLRGVKGSTDPEESAGSKKGSAKKAGRRPDDPNHKNDKDVTNLEFNIAPHRQQPKSRQPYASHHGIQKKYLADYVPSYDPEAAPTMLLKQGKGASHSRITGDQTRERAEIRRATGNPYAGDYGEWRARAIEQMRRNGVPEEKIGQWVLEHDGYMFEIGRKRK
jgi:hypothetical protein